jgi:hypothetical protein
LEVLFVRVNHTMMSAQNVRQRHSNFHSNAKNQQTNGASPALINQFSKIDLVKSIRILIIQIILFSLPNFVHIYNPTFLPTCHIFISIKTFDITHSNIHCNLEQTFSNIQHWHQI